MKSRFSVALALTCLLASCQAGFSPEALPHLEANDLRWFVLEEHDAQNTLRYSNFLAVQALSDRESRWIYSDAFGAPLARMLVSEKGFRNDGFLPPNPAAQRIFAHLFHYVDQENPEPYSFRLDQKNWRIAPLKKP